MAQSLKIRSGQPVSRKELKFCIWAPETTTYPGKKYKNFRRLECAIFSQLAKMERLPILNDQGQG